MIKRENAKELLDSRWFYVILIVLTSIVVLVGVNSKRSSNYTLEDEVFEGVLVNLVVSKTKVAFEIDGEEKLICNQYVDESTDVENIRKNFRLGTRVEIKGELKEPLNNTVPNTFNYKKYLRNHGMFYTCTAKEVRVLNDDVSILYRIKNAIIDRIMTFKIKDYMYTMIIGDKSLLDKETFEKYRKNGVTHLFAISGMHIGLFTGVVLYLLGKMRFNKNKKYIVTICFIWFYAFLTGFSASVQRACVLFSLMSIFKIAKIDISTLKVLVITGCLLVIFDYTSIFDIGFIYSFTTTFGLLYSSKVIEKHKVLGTSLVATLYSLPITIVNFYKVNLLSTFFNVVFVPFVSVVVYPLCLLSFVFRFLSPVTEMAIFFLEMLNDLLSKVDFLYVVIPKMSWIVLVLYYVVLIFGLKKNLYKISVILFSIALVCKVKPLLDANYYVEYLDVGQGDSILIRSPHSEEIVLIDTGGKESFGENKSSFHVAHNTLEYMNSLGLDRIDYLILSHGDADHLGDAMYLIENMHVGKVILNVGELNLKEKEIVESGVEISEIYDGTMDLTLLNRDKDWKDENANSTIVELKISDNVFLFLGDATREVERSVMSNLKRADFVKLGHHGSKTSSDEEFLDKLNPSVAIISSGRNNRYGHPNKETIDTLEKLGIDYMNTQETGTISYKIKGEIVTFGICPP